MSDLEEFNENKLQAPWLETESPNKFLAQEPGTSSVMEAPAPTLWRARHCRSRSCPGLGSSKQTNKQTRFTISKR